MVGITGCIYTDHPLGLCVSWGRIRVPWPTRRSRLSKDRQPMIRQLERGSLRRNVVMWDSGLTTDLFGATCCDSQSSFVERSSHFPSTAQNFFIYTSSCIRSKLSMYLLYFRPPPLTGSVTLLFRFSLAQPDKLVNSMSVSLLQGFVLQMFSFGHRAHTSCFLPLINQ